MTFPSLVVRLTLHAIPTSFIYQLCPSFVSRTLSSRRTTISSRLAHISRVHASTLGAHRSRPFTNLTCIILHVVNLIILRVMDLHASRGTPRGKQALAPLASPWNGVHGG